jgi:hypothetical protein
MNENYLLEKIEQEKQSPDSFTALPFYYMEFSLMLLEV